jgi:hypothetical protein
MTVFGQPQRKNIQEPRINNQGLSNLYSMSILEKYGIPTASGYRLSSVWGVVVGGGIPPLILKIFKSQGSIIKG